MNVDLLLEQKSVGIWIFPLILLLAGKYLPPRHLLENRAEHCSQFAKPLRMCKITDAIKMTFYEDIIIKCSKDMFEINKALTRTKFLEELLFIQLEEGKFQ